MGEHDDSTGRAQQDPSGIPIPEIFRPASTQEEAIPEDQWALLCSRPEAAAAATCARLETEGIPARTRQPEASSDDGAEVEVQVPRDLLDTAREILSHPERSEPQEDDCKDEDYYLRRWICPACHVGEIEPKPLARPWRCVGWTVLVMLGITAFVWCMQSLDRDNLQQLAELLEEWCWMWFGTIAVLAIAFMCVLGNKHCPRCGWQLSGGKQQSDSGR